MRCSLSSRVVRGKFSIEKFLHVVKSRLKTVQALHLSGFLECDKSKNPVQFCLSLSMKIGLKVMEPKLRLIPGFYLNSYFFQISVMTCDMVTDAYSKTMKTGGPIANEE